MSDEKEVIKVSIAETSPDCWRIAHNGRVLGDSRGYRKEQAIAEIYKLCDADYRCVVYVLDAPRLRGII